MNTKKLFIKLPFVLSILLVFTLSVLTCKIGPLEFRNPFEGFQLAISAGEITTIFNGTIVNAATGVPLGMNLGDRSITITFSGPDKDKLLSFMGESLGDQPQTLSKGFLGFSLDYGLSPTAEDPIDFTVVVSSPGYVSSSKRVVAVAEGETQFMVTLVKVEASPEGTVSVQRNMGTVNEEGALAETITLTTNPEVSPPPGEEKAEARITLPADTVILDKDNNPLTGALSEGITYFTPETPESLSSFPGGFGVALASDETGSENDGYFTTGGFIALEIEDEAGNKAETFVGNPLEVTLEIDEGTYNQGIALGTLPIWSYDDATGEWTYETEGIPSAEGGKYYVTFGAGHLSYWNLDWFWESCNMSRKVIFNGLPPGIPLYIEVFADGFWHDAYTWGDDWIIFYYAPSFPVNMNVYLNGPGGTLVISATGISLCADGDLVLTAEEMELPRYIDVYIDILLICTNAPVTLEWSLPFWYKREPSGSWVYAGFLNNGEMYVPGVEIPPVGETYTYTIGSQYGGQWVQAVFAVTLVQQDQGYITVYSTNDPTVPLMDPIDFMVDQDANVRLYYEIETDCSTLSF